jgi:hypothetical protein
MKKLLLLALFCVRAFALTTVSETLHVYDGSLFDGSITIVAPALTTAAGAYIPKWQRRYTITSGVVSIALEPNDTALPASTTYDVYLYPTSGQSTVEYWYVPTSVSPVTVGQVRLQIKPTAGSLITPGQIVQSGAAKGSLIINTGSTWLPFTVCPDGQSMVADSAQTFGWTCAVGGSGGGMSNPMTTIGDMIVAASGGTPIRLASIANSNCTGPITLTNGATVQRISLTANCVLTFPSAGLFPGQLYTLRLAQDATGGRTVSVSANVHGFMVVSTSPDTVSVQDFFWDDVKALWYARNTGVQNQ